jgi:hypothetical protein
LNSLLKNKLLLLPAILLSLNAVAWSNVIPNIGRPAGMGNAFISQYDLDAELHNQAGLANLSSLSLSLFIENRFLVKDLASRGILIGIPAASGVFAACIYAFGPAKWIETNLSVAYAKKLSSKISTGIQINYFGMKLPEENQTISSVSAELGIICQLSQTLFVGIHLANPFSIPFKTSTSIEEIPYRYRVGGHTLITNELIFAFEVEKVKSRNILFKAGMEWEVAKNLYLRGGYNSGPSKLSTGIGFNYRCITADIAFNYHQVLGVTPSLSIKLNLK